MCHVCQALLILLCLLIAQNNKTPPKQVPTLQVQADVKQVHGAIGQQEAEGHPQVAGHEAGRFEHHTEAKPGSVLTLAERQLHVAGELSVV